MRCPGFLAGLSLADVAYPPTVDITHVTGNEPVNYALVFGLIVLVEAVLLRLLRWGNWKHCGWCSLVINAVSSVPGVILLLSDGALFSRLSPEVWLAGSYVLTVVIEAFVLRWLQRSATLGRAFKVSVLINLGSYVLLALLVILTSHPRPHPPRPPYPLKEDRSRQTPTPPPLPTVTPTPAPSASP